METTNQEKTSVDQQNSIVMNQEKDIDIWSPYRFGNVNTKESFIHITGYLPH